MAATTDFRNVFTGFVTPNPAPSQLRPPNGGDVAQTYADAIVQGESPSSAYSRTGLPATTATTPAPAPTPGGSVGSAPVRDTSWADTLRNNTPTVSYTPGTYDPNARNAWDDAASAGYAHQLDEAQNAYRSSLGLLDASQSTGARRAAAQSALSGNSALGGAAVAGQAQASRDSDLARLGALADYYTTMQGIYGAQTKGAEARGDAESGRAADVNLTNINHNYDAGVVDANHRADTETNIANNMWASGENDSSSYYGLLGAMLGNPDIDWTPEDIATLFGGIGGNAGATPAPAGTNSADVPVPSTGTAPRTTLVTGSQPRTATVSLANQPSRTAAPNARTF